MSSDPAPLGLVVAEAPKFEAVVFEMSSAHAHVEVPVRSNDGRAPQYVLYLSNDGDGVSVREIKPTQLPEFCPGLHINHDGTFCLGLKGRDDLSVRDPEGAQRWWGRLLAFLRLQARSKRRGAWVGPEWPHGEAGEHQAGAEQAAQSLGEDFRNELSQGRLSASWGQRSFDGKGRVLRVFRGTETTAYGLWEKHGRVINRRQACICKKGSIKRHRRVKSCDSHEQAAKQLALAIVGVHEAEAQFWSRYKGRTCCEILSVCRLRQ